MQRFKNRAEAGLLLAEKLEKYKNQEAVILAIPRGGLPVSKVVAEKLGLPLDIILSKKIGFPTQKEYAIGAVTLQDCIVDSTVELPENYLQNEIQRIRLVLQKRHQEYYKNRSPIILKDKIVIIVDDGIATGLTLLSTIQLIRQQKPKQIVVAVPVASSNSVDLFINNQFIDDFISVLVPDHFNAVGQFYENFNQVSEEEVLQILSTPLII